MKKFSTRDENSWHRETEIYTMLNVRHDNVLTCFAAEIFANAEMTELWLITQFHRSGSLFDVLNVEVLSLSQALQLPSSITQGLSYLHNIEMAYCRAWLSDRTSTLSTSKSDPLR